MALPVTIPNEFANATASIPLSQLDTNFNTLANAVNGISDGSESLANVSVTGGTISNVAVSATTLNTSGAVVFNDAGADVDFRVEGDTEANLLFVDASTDRVGIGTSSPATNLAVLGVASGTLTDSAQVLGAGNVENVRIMGYAYGANQCGLALLSGASGSAAVGLFGLKTGTNQAALAIRMDTGSGTSAERMRIDSSGNVGIGTSSMSRRLVIKGSDNLNGAILLKSSSTADGDNGFMLQCFGTNSEGYLWHFNAQPIIFGTNATERMRITSGGYLKASDTGAYIGSSSGYHEFTNTVNNDALYVRASDASYTNTVLYPFATRSASSAYSIFKGGSGAGTDVEFNLRGDGNAYADGTWNNNGADYAEFFESANGQALTLGATVVLDGNKVREATDQDPASAIIGVVRPKEPSKASMVVGNTAWNKWANKYLTDDFDRYIMEDHDVVEWEEQVLEREAVEAVEAVVDEEGIEVSPAVPAQEAVYKTVQRSYESHNIPEGITVPEDATRKTHDEKGNKFQHYKLNPAWNSDSEYVNRENRPEWNIIGLLGQVKILKGQPVGDRWIKMRDVSETVEEWMIR